MSMRSVRKSLRSAGALLLAASALLTGCAEEPREPARLADRPPLSATKDTERLARQVAARAALSVGTRLQGGLRLKEVDSDPARALFVFLMEGQTELPPPPSEAAMKAAREGLASGACPASTPLERELLRAGGGLLYRYLTKDGVPVHELELREQDCAPMWSEALDVAGEGEPAARKKEAPAPEPAPPAIQETPPAATPQTAPSEEG